MFDVDELTDADRETLGGGGALLAALTESRTGRMRDIVATIQAEQDRVIRADPAGVLVVQGGPGTGKTAVALHRAAYLLYTQPRAARAHRRPRGRTGADLPALHRAGAAVARRDRRPALDARRSAARHRGGGHEPDRGGAAQGRPADGGGWSAPRSRRASECPTEPVTIGVEDHELVLDAVATSRPRAARARRSRRRHNRARYAFAKQLLRPLMGRLAEIDPELRADRCGASARSWRRRSSARVIDACWPRLTMSELIDAAAHPGRARRGGRATCSAGASGSCSCASRVRRGPRRTSRCSTRRGRCSATPKRCCASRRSAGGCALERVYAQQVDRRDRAARPGRRRRTGRAVRRAVSVGAAVAERAAGDPDWEFGHVIVDEAQELSPMAWRMLVRRCPMRSMTVVGDVAQASRAVGRRVAGPTTLNAVAPDRWRVARADRQLPHAERDHGGGCRRPRRRRTRTPCRRHRCATPVPAAGPPRRRRCGPRRRRRRRRRRRVARAPIGDGRLAVLTPARRLRRRCAAAAATSVRRRRRDRRAGLDSPIAVLEIGDAKGLEFDAVVLVEPGELARRRVSAACATSMSR